MSKCSQSKLRRLTGMLVAITMMVSSGGYIYADESDETEISEVQPTDVEISDESFTEDTGCCNG